MNERTNERTESTSRAEVWHQAHETAAMIACVFSFASSSACSNAFRCSCTILRPSILLCTRGGDIAPAPPGGVSPSAMPASHFSIRTRLRSALSHSVRHPPSLFLSARIFLPASVVAAAFTCVCSDIVASDVAVLVVNVRRFVRSGIAAAGVAGPLSGGGGGNSALTGETCGEYRSSYSSSPSSSWSPSRAPWSGSTSQSFASSTMLSSSVASAFPAVGAERVEEGPGVCALELASGAVTRSSSSGRRERASVPPGSAEILRNSRSYSSSSRTWPSRSRVASLIRRIMSDASRSSVPVPVPATDDVELESGRGSAASRWRSWARNFSVYSRSAARIAIGSCCSGCRRGRVGDATGLRKPGSSVEDTSAAAVAVVGASRSDSDSGCPKSSSCAGECGDAPLSWAASEFAAGDPLLPPLLPKCTSSSYGVCECGEDSS
ncbi:hypothetical protein GSI_12557 [Ganoderma sinense ZZ0214-1]|uniref:Uncharacterized protein n=1 Tax=Ganoderma sinense ZZ0214-1 TaxID=1077348 RepID=A0A2G8RT53_9APHY|nr:hypothetical protein GSI_12557 [Ganoderma sinense ZZ0214-1]